MRCAQINSAVGSPWGQSLLLRSASSLTPPRSPRTALDGARQSSPPNSFCLQHEAAVLAEQWRIVGGKGTSSRTLLGFRLENPRVRLIVAPEIVSSSNRDWPLRLPIYIPHEPPLPPGRSPSAFLTTLANSPSISRCDSATGKSTGSIRSILSADFRSPPPVWLLERERVVGARHSERDRPQQQRSGAFPHLLVRTAAPIDTRFGALEMRWLVGGLTESRFFDSVSTNNTRSLASLAASLQTKWDPNLSFGFARSVYSTATGWGQVPWRWFDVLARTSHSETSRIKKDQLFSLFARWVFPPTGSRCTRNGPGHASSQVCASCSSSRITPRGYTLGLQWRGAEWHSGTFRVQTEITQLEQSATFRDQPGPSWYPASERVIQGYTNRGAILGASIGSRCVKPVACHRLPETELALWVVSGTHQMERRRPQQRQAAGVCRVLQPRCQPLPGYSCSKAGSTWLPLGGPFLSE